MALTDGRHNTINVESLESERRLSPTALILERRKYKDIYIYIYKNSEIYDDSFQCYIYCI